MRKSSMQDQIMELLEKNGTISRSTIASILGKSAYSNLVSLKKQKMLTITKAGQVSIWRATGEDDEPPRVRECAELSKVGQDALTAVADLIAENARLRAWADRLSASLEELKQL